MRLAITAFALAALPISLGCFAGAMGQAKLNKPCGPNDAACLRAGLDAPLAVGATFRPQVSLNLKGTAAPVFQLVSARSDVIAAHENQLTGKAPGLAAILIATEDGTILDFTHILVSQPTHMKLHQIDRDRTELGEISDSIGLVIGESVYVEPRIYSASQQLAGSSTTTWKIDSDVAVILRDGSSGRRRIVARRAGRTTLSVSTLGLETTLHLVVVK